MGKKEDFIELYNQLEGVVTQTAETQNTVGQQIAKLISGFKVGDRIRYVPGMDGKVYGFAEAMVEGFDWHGYPNEAEVIVRPFNKNGSLSKSTHRIWVNDSGDYRAEYEKVG